MNTISAWLEAAFLGNQAVYALGWTLLHSLWQGGALALMVMIGQWFLRERSANARYLVALCGLVAMLFGSIATFFYYLQALNEAVQWADKHSLVAQHILQSSSQASPLLKAKIFLNQHLMQIVTFWSVGFAIYLVRYLGSYIYCQNLRRSKVYVAPAEWVARVQQLALTMGVTSSVALKISRRVHSPCVIGHLKPLILVPAALFTHLDPKEIEAILLHELAHIRRHDYLVGLCQSLMKVIYFFNPFVLWMSSRADSERENACDDIAVDRCNDRMLYARALEAFTSIPQNGGLVMAATGNRQHIFSRVRRLFGDGATKPSPIEGLVASLVIALSCIAVSVQASAGKDDGGHYAGIQSLTGVETAELLDHYAGQIIDEDGPVFTTEVMLEQRLNQLSRDERAAFVGHLKERVWDQTYANWERPEHFQHLDDDRWLELRKLWLDDNYGHLLAHIEVPTQTAERLVIATPDGTPGVEGRIDRAGERLEFKIPLELVERLETGGGAIESDAARILFNEKGDLVIQLDSIPGGEGFDAAPAEFPEMFAAGALRGRTTHVAAHFGKEFQLVEVKGDFVKALISGKEKAHGNGRLGAQIDEDGYIAVAVEPERFNANRKVFTKFVSPDMWQVSSEHTSEVEEKLAKLDSKKKALLPTPQEWNRWRLIQDLRQGEPISDQQWAAIKNRFLNHNLDTLLNYSEDHPRYQSLASEGFRYGGQYGVYVSVQEPEPKDDQLVFDIDLRQTTLAEVVKFVRSYCPDESFSPELEQHEAEVTVVAPQHSCSQSQVLLDMIARREGLEL